MSYEAAAEFVAILFYNVRCGTFENWRKVGLLNMLSKPCGG